MGSKLRGLAGGSMEEKSYLFFSEDFQTFLRRMVVPEWNNFEEERLKLEGKVLTQDWDCMMKCYWPISCFFFQCFYLCRKLWK